MSRTAKGLLVVLLSAGCSEWGLERTNGNGGGDNVPDIAVEPASIDFGMLGGEERTSAVLTVRNEGPESVLLDVDRLRIDGGASFALVDPPETFALLGGESRELIVSFSPETPEEHQARVEIESDDPDEPTLHVPLRGSGRVPELVIEPDPLDLGSVVVGCATEGTFTLRNVGTFPLTVSALDVDGPGASLAEPFVLPLVVVPESPVPVPIRFAPPSEGGFDGRLVVTSDEALGVREARHAGSGRLLARYTDRFELPVDPPADLLMFVDQSWSMRDDQIALAANFDTFIRQIDAGTPDWRLLVVNSDNGCSESGVLTRDTAGYDALFATAVQSGGGSLTESGLSVIATALEQTSEGECNEGFLRTEALLHVIFVTDEREQSPGAWEDYLARMRAAKGSPWLVRASAVAGDLPEGCTTLTNSAAAAMGYADVVAATGGAFLSICSEWGANVGVLADVTIRRDTFPLSAAPDPGTVRVSVNGVPLATGWRWDPEPNTVVFDALLAPLEGDVVEVAYDEPLPCAVP
jgi:hypothetical protein